MSFPLGDAGGEGAPGEDDSGAALTLKVIAGR